MSSTQHYEHMDMAEYLADPAPEPSLSASIIHRLITQSPRHAWTHHPRLNPDYRAEESDRFDLGTAAHAFILEPAEGSIVIVDAPDWRTKAAQTARDGAKLRGQVALLRHQFEQVGRLASALGPQLGRMDKPRPFTLQEGLPEQTLIWQEGETWCRARLDWLHNDRKTVDDLKTVGGSANPEAVSRSMLYAMGWDVKAAWYIRGCERVFGNRPDFRLVCVETEAPYAASMIGLGPDALVLAEKKILWALEKWRECMGSGVWPSYEPRTHYAELPPWMEAQWLTKELEGERP